MNVSGHEFGGDPRLSLRPQHRTTVAIVLASAIVSVGILAGAMFFSPDSTRSVVDEAEQARFLSAFDAAETLNHPLRIQGSREKWKAEEFHDHTRRVAYEYDSPDDAPMLRVRGIRYTNVPPKDRDRRRSELEAQLGAAWSEPTVAALISPPLGFGSVDVGMGVQCFRLSVSGRSVGAAVLTEEDATLHLTEVYADSLEPLDEEMLVDAAMKRTLTGFRGAY